MNLFVYARGICVDESRYWHFDELSAATLFYPFFPPYVGKQGGCFSVLLVAVSRVCWHLNDGPIHGPLPN